jgi:hypothetical protein
VLPLVSRPNHGNQRTFHALHGFRHRKACEIETPIDGVRLAEDEMRLPEDTASGTNLCTGSVIPEEDVAGGSNESLSDSVTSEAGSTQAPLDPTEPDRHDRPTDSG